jgi:hypothetical protein
VAPGDADAGAGDALAASGRAAAWSAVSLARPGSRTTRNTAAATATTVMSTLTATDEPRDPRGVIAPPLYSAAGLRAGRLRIRPPADGPAAWHQRIMLAIFTAGNAVIAWRVKRRPWSHVFCLVSDVKRRSTERRTIIRNDDHRRPG